MTSHDEVKTLHDLVIHGGITSGDGRGSSNGSGGSSSGSGGGRGTVGTGSGVDKVVGHLRVELLGGLLSGAAAAGTAASLLAGVVASVGGSSVVVVAALGTGSGALGSVATALVVGGRLGLALGLRDALAQRLGLGDQLGLGDDNLNLHGTVVDKQTVELGEGLAGTIGVVEDNRGDTAANTTGAVGELDLLDLADSLLEVVLLCCVGQLFEGVKNASVVKVLHRKVVIVVRKEQRTGPGRVDLSSTSTILSAASVAFRPCLPRVAVVPEPKVIKSSHVKEPGTERAVSVIANQVNKYPANPRAI